MREMTELFENVGTIQDGINTLTKVRSVIDAPGAKALAVPRGGIVFDNMRFAHDDNDTPHVARNDSHQGGSAIDGRTSRHAGYGISQVIRKRIEEHFAWGKTVGRIRQTGYRGVKRGDRHFELTMPASSRGLGSVAGRVARITKTPVLLVNAPRS